MKKLFFTSLRIRKAPGFREGLNVPGFRDLSPEINIIAGPNGAGKSTAARTIMALLWPDRKKRDLDASVDFVFEGKKWSEHLGSGELKVQQDGNDRELPERPPENYSKIYMLAMHELVNNADSDLAERIVEESMGGINLDKAGQNLKYSGSLRNRGSYEYKEYRKAYENFRKTEAGQSSLEARERILTELKRKQESARQAKTEMEFLRLAGEMLTAGEELKAWDEKIKEFPEVLAKLKGDESDIIDQLELKIGQEHADIIKHERILREREAVITGLKLPDDGSAQKTADRLSESARSLAEYEDKQERISCEIENLATIESGEREKIGRNADREKLKKINIKQIGEIQDHFRDTLTLEEKRARLSNEIGDIEKEEGERQSRTADLSIRINDLRKNAAGNAPNDTPAWLFILVALLGIIASLATLIFGKPGLAAVILIVASTVMAIFRKNKRKEDEGEPARDELAELEKELRAEMLRDERISRKNFLECELKKVRTNLDSLGEKSKKLLNELGTIPELESDPNDTSSCLFQFLAHLQSWQKANLEIEAKTAELSGYEELKKDEISRCNMLLGTLGIEPINASSELFAGCAQLTRKESERKAAVKDIQNAMDQISSCVTRMHEHALTMRNIYDKLATPYGEIQSVRRHVAMFADFTIARTNQSAGQRYLADHESRVRLHPLYRKHKDEIADWDQEMIRKKSGIYSELAASYETHTKDIAEIEAEINQKKLGNELENALNAKNMARIELEKLFEDNISSITGKMILDQLKSENDKSSRPGIMSRADKLFGIITNGRYSLKTDNEREPVFRAFDNVLQEGFDLEQLSTATRVQLLLSVRIAFIESREGSGIRLPIIADELLANSDEIRAEAIIDSLCEISKQGRQVFYFTAQQDEVMRWQSIINGKKEKPDYRIIDMWAREYDKIPDAGRGLMSLRFANEIPEPAGMNINEYQKLLNIRPFDILTDSAEQLPLPLMTENTSIVYDCMKKGISVWGMLSSYCNNGGRIESVTEEILEKMRIKSVLLAEFQELYRPGRPKKVGLDIILDSGRVKDKYVDQVKEQLDRAKGNPKVLLEFLPDIPKFSRYVPDIKEYLEKLGYVDDTEPLSWDQIRIRLQARISQLGVDEKEAEDFFSLVLSN